MNYIKLPLKCFLLLLPFSFSCKVRVDKSNMSNESKEINSNYEPEDITDSNIEDSLYVKIYNENIVIAKNKQYGSYLKRPEHPGLIQIRDKDNFNKIVAYILYDSLGNKVIEDNIEVNNPFKDLRGKKIETSEQFKSIFPNKDSPSFIGSYFLLDKNILTPDEKQLFIPNIKPLYTNNLEPHLFKITQSVGGIRHQKRNEVIVSYSLTVFNKGYIPIKFIDKYDFLNSDGKLITSKILDDFGYMNSFFLSKDSKKIVLWIGGDICCEGANLVYPEYRIYSFPDFKFLETTFKFPYEIISMPYDENKDLMPNYTELHKEHKQEESH